MSAVAGWAIRYAKQTSAQPSAGARGCSNARRMARRDPTLA